MKRALHDTNTIVGSKILSVRSEITDPLLPKQWIDFI